MFDKILIDYMASGHSILAIKTHEKNRVIEEIDKAAKKINRSLYIWSISSGMAEYKSDPENTEKTPDVAISCAITKPQKSVFVFKDYDFYMNYGTYQQCDIINSALQECLQDFAATEKTIIIVGATLNIPEVLKHDIPFIDFSLPTDDHIEKLLKFVCEGVVTENGKPLDLPDESIPPLVAACRGMSQNQIIDRFALAIRKNKNINSETIKIILQEKSNIIKNSNILQYHDIPSVNMSTIGGYDVLKQHIVLEKPCFSKDALEFGIEPPKGILLVGVPGSGKTLASKAIAGELNIPLVSMDVANIMGSLVGESESHMRDAIKLLDAISPCVLQLDEVEKMFGGNGDLDGGTSKRVFGQFLKYLSEKDKYVYIIATANNVSSLPPEFLRSGRFDAMFGFDLPSFEERKEIFKIHLAKRLRDVSDINFESVAKDTDGFTGADIEQVVKLSLKMAFPDKLKITSKLLSLAADQVTPLSKIEPDKIDILRDWMKKHCKIANNNIDQVKTSNKRKVEI